MSPMQAYGRIPEEDRCDVTLLATIVGGSQAHQRARAALDMWGSLDALARADPLALGRVLGPASGDRVHAALALARRALRRRPAPESAIDTPQRAADLLWPRLIGSSQEELHAAFLDRRHRLLALRQLTRGSEAYTIVEPRQIFALALSIGATQLVLAHNHPTGDPRPSTQDLEVTRRTANAGQLIGVRLLDHLIFADTAWTSLASEGSLPPWRAPEPSLMR